MQLVLTGAGSAAVNGVSIVYRNTHLGSRVPNTTAMSAYGEGNSSLCGRQEAENKKTTKVQI